MHQTQGPPPSWNQRILDSLAFSNAVYAPDLEEAVAYLLTTFTGGLHLIHQQGFGSRIDTINPHNDRIIHELQDEQQQQLLCAIIPSPDESVTEPELIVACRGTSDLFDVLQDLKCLPVRLRYAARHTAHCGFAERADSIPIYRFIEFLRKTRGSITFTGHSLGGAVASLLALRLLEEMAMDPEGCSTNRIRCITFGAPLFAGSGLARRIDARYRAAFLHVVMRGDCVPKALPLLSTLQRMVFDDDHWEGFRAAAGLIARLLPGAASRLLLLPGPARWLLRLLVPVSFSYDFAGQFLVMDDSICGSFSLSSGEKLNAWHSRLAAAFGFWRDAFAGGVQHRIMSYKEAITAAPPIAMPEIPLALKLPRDSDFRVSPSFTYAADAATGKCVLGWKPGRLLGLIGRISRNIRALKSVCPYTFFFRAFSSLIHRLLVVDRGPLPLF